MVTAMATDGDEATVVTMAGIADATLAGSVIIVIIVTIGDR